MAVSTECKLQRYYLLDTLVIVISRDLATDNGSKWLFLRQTSYIYLVQQKCEVYKTADNEHDNVKWSW